MKIDEVKNKILQLAIQGKLVPQDENDIPASVLLEEIKKEQLIKENKENKERKTIKGMFFEKVKIFLKKKLLV